MKIAINIYALRSNTDETSQFQVMAAICNHTIFHHDSLLMLKRNRETNILEKLNV